MMCMNETATWQLKLLHSSQPAIIGFFPELFWKFWIQNTRASFNCRKVFYERNGTRQTEGNTQAQNGKMAESKIGLWKVATEC